MIKEIDRVHEVRITKRAPYDLHYSIPVAPVSPPEKHARRAQVDDRLVLTLARGVTMDFVRVPAGEFLMGNCAGGALAQSTERPQHCVDLPYTYWIARCPVTNDQFAAFMHATHYVTTAEEKLDPLTWRHPGGLKSDLKNKGDHPVVCVSWHDALAYSSWLDEISHEEWSTEQVRLPTEAEWEKAARGINGRIYPWGNEWDAARCNNIELGLKATSAVGKFPNGASPFGCLDMAGNVWEWTSTQFKTYPYRLDDGRENLANRDTGLRVMRGGAFTKYRQAARCSYRFRINPIEHFWDGGFRVVISSVSL